MKNNKEAKRWLKSRGITNDSVELFQLTYDDNRMSTMYGRVLIPVKDQYGSQVGIQGRAVLDDIKPKYLFTKNFDKNRYLYNIHIARTLGLLEGVIGITEGTINSIIGLQAGLPIVSTFGTGMSQSQLMTLARYTKDVIVIEDNDGPGKTDAVSKYELLTDNGFNCAIMSFSAYDINDINEFVLERSEKELQVFWNKHL